VRNKGRKWKRTRTKIERLQKKGKKLQRVARSASPKNKTDGQKQWPERGKWVLRGPYVIDRRKGDPFAKKGKGAKNQDTTGGKAERKTHSAIMTKTGEKVEKMG